MMLVLTCALCAAVPETLTLRTALIDGQLSVAEREPAGRTPLALAPLAEEAGGGGDHSGHMGPMWIVMGVMMAVMVVGMAAYFMRHSTTTHMISAGPIASPAQLALPVSAARGGAG